MTAPAQKKAKEMGLNNLKQATELGWARSTLVDMHNNRPDRFEIVILGCLVKLEQMRKAVNYNLKQ
tara:strand:+ start:1590 stop:1787 length:198 start_codon:yes stop_codon:yes gene_type:complete